MAKITKHPVKILKVTEYKGYPVVVQQIVPEHIFQYFIAKDGDFYQAWNRITPPRGFSKKLEEDEVLKAAAVTLDMAYATIDALINKDNPDKLLEENAQGAEVVRVLEEANAPVQTAAN